jgi:hypothetical protein
VTAGYAGAVRPLGRVVLLAAALVAGCGYHEHVLSAADRKLCNDTARGIAAPGSQRYKEIYDACLHNLQHPERGGG